MNKAILAGLFVVFTVLSAGCINPGLTPPGEVPDGLPIFPTPEGPPAPMPAPSPTPQPTPEPVITPQYTYPTLTELMLVLGGFEHAYEYEEDVFDCTEMSIVTAYILQEGYGWNTKIGVDYDWYHAWVVVETSDDTWLAIEATDGGIGAVVFINHEEDYYNADVWVEWYEAYNYTH